MINVEGNFDEEQDICMVLKILSYRLLISCEGGRKTTIVITQVEKLDYIFTGWSKLT